MIDNEKDRQDIKDIKDIKVLQSTVTENQTSKPFCCLQLRRTEEYPHQVIYSMSFHGRSLFTFFVYIFIEVVIFMN